jgi:predicted nucleotidyltransferase
MQKEILEALRKIFKSEEKISVAYLFGSHAKKLNTLVSDIDIAVLLSEAPKNLFEYYLYLVNKLSRIVGDDLDLIILNTASPMLKHQIIKYGKIIYTRNEKERIMFESRAESEYLDFSRALKRYDECLIKQILT